MSIKPFLSTQFSKLSPILLMLGLMGCQQDLPKLITFSAPIKSANLDQEAIKTVNRAFYASFLGGDWFYQGAEIDGDQVNAYIQIPSKLNMSIEAQQNYVRQAICPSEKAYDVWYKLKKSTLSVRLYTMNKHINVKAECDNPNLKKGQRQA